MALAPLGFECACLPPDACQESQPTQQSHRKDQSSSPGSEEDTNGSNGREHDQGPAGMREAQGSNPTNVTGGNRNGNGCVATAWALQC